MKKLIALLLALVMVIGLVACGNNNAETPLAATNSPPVATKPPLAATRRLKAPSTG